MLGRLDERLGLPDGTSRAPIGVEMIAGPAGRGDRLGPSGGVSP